MSEQITDNKLYAIELENEKVFLHFSPPVYQDILFRECIVLFDFVKKNRPLKILKVIDINDVLEIDYYVKYYMRYYGIENVRGGNYSNEFLTNNEIDILKKEINKTTKDYENDIEIFESIFQNFQKNNVTEKEINELDKKWKIYSNKKKIMSILYDKDNYESIENFYIFKTIIHDIEWMQEKMKELHNTYNKYYESQKEISKDRNMLSFIQKIPNLVANDDKKQYKEILERLGFLTKIYLLINKENLEEYMDSCLRNKIDGFKSYDTKSFMYIHIQKPRFILDYFFLHPNLISNWDNYVAMGEELLNEFSYMA